MYVLAVAETDNPVANFVIDLWDRLTADLSRLAICILALVAFLILAALSKNTTDRILAIVGGIGAFNLAWIVVNTFSTPQRHDPLLGPNSQTATLSDLFHGWGFVVLAVFLLLLVPRFRASGFRAILVLVAVATGLLVIIDLIYVIQSWS